MKMMRFFTFFLAQLILSNLTWAAEKTPLTLNGTGIRTATIFAVKVYRGSLFLEHPSHDANAIIRSNESKRVEMEFLHKVSADQMRGAFKEGFENNCKPNCDALAADLNQLNQMLVDLKVGDSMRFDFLPTKVELRIRGEKVGEITDPPFAKVLLATWLGPKPPTEDLKAGMLGLSH